MDYLFKTGPRAHQLAAFELSREREEFALLHEQGTGKTKVLIDNAAYLYAHGEITGHFVVTLKGAHLNWVLNEMPKHHPDYVPLKMAAWRAGAGIKESKALEEALYSTGPHLRMLSMNFDALITKKGFAAAEKFVRTHHVMLTIDESHKIKTPGIARTKKLLKLGKIVPYRRIATGTLTDKPFDAYAQFNFLNEDILGFSNFTAFKAHFAEMLPINDRLVQAIMRKGARWAPQIEARNPDGSIQYRNLDELKALIAPYSHRVLKRDCYDLPEKQYVRQYVEMLPEQQRIYEQMRDKAKALINGELRSARNRLIVVMRLQEILGGYFEGTRILPIVEDPRLAALLDIAEDQPGKMIVWARFRHEIADITHVLRKEYGTAAVAELHGGIKDMQRMANIDRFQDPDSPVRFIIGNQATGGASFTMHAAETVVYYSNESKLIDRLQSEDRAHRDGLTHPVLYIDMETPGTVDGHIIDALQLKKDVADAVVGDAFVKWLT
jgi:SNF2 family DNA or RNA helicase